MRVQGDRELQEPQGGAWDPGHRGSLGEEGATCCPRTPSRARLSQPGRCKHHPRRLPSPFSTCCKLPHQTLRDLARKQRHAELLPEPGDGDHLP